MKYPSVTYSLAPVYIVTNVLWELLFTVTLAISLV